MEPVKGCLVKLEKGLEQKAKTHRSLGNTEKEGKDAVG